MLLNVNYLGQEIDSNTIKPIQSKTAAIHELDLMKFFRSMNF